MFERAWGLQVRCACVCVLSACVVLLLQRPVRGLLQGTDRGALDNEYTICLNGGKEI